MDNGLNCFEAESCFRPFSCIQRICVLHSKNSSYTAKLLENLIAEDDLSNPKHWTSSLMFSETNHTWGFSQNESLNYLRFDCYHFIKVPDLVALDKSTGLGGYGNIVIKNCLKTWRRLLLLIFQTIINKITYPSFWKISEVSHLFIDGNKADVTYYRSICLLCSTSKLIEKKSWLHLRTMPPPFFWESIWLQKIAIWNTPLTVVSQLCFSKTWHMQPWTGIVNSALLRLRKGTRHGDTWHVNIECKKVFNSWKFWWNFRHPT